MEVSPDLVTNTEENVNIPKEEINKSEDKKEKSGILWIMAGLAIILIIIFGIVVLVFFLLGNKPQMHEIAIVNNCANPINILVGTEKDATTLKAFSAKRLNPGEVAYYYSTPAVYFVVQGYYDNTVLPESYPYPLTKALLWFGDNGYNGNTQITDGNNIMDVPRSNKTSTPSTEDNYDISMQDGFNIQIGIISTNFNNKDPSNPFSCVGPTWNYNINERMCFKELQYPGGITGYQACSSPCFAGLIGQQYYCCSESEEICNIDGGCENSWPNMEFYSLFENACPNCMITNCDTPLYGCSSSGGLTQYVITFCPS